MMFPITKSARKLTGIVKITIPEVFPERKPLGNVIILPVICYATQASVANLLQNVKIFDDDSKSEHLQDFTTFNSDVSVNVMATQMNFLGKLAGGDLMALEAKYHFTCLTKYRNQYRSHIRSDTS